MTTTSTGLHVRCLTDVDTPLLQAGLMGTLHAILDEPAAAKAAEQEIEAAILGRPIGSPSFVSVPSAPAAAAPATAGSAASTVPGTANPLASPSGSQASDRKAGEPPSSPSPTGGLMSVKKIVAISQHKKKNREHLMRSSPDILDRILAVSGLEEQGKLNGSSVSVVIPAYRYHSTAVVSW